MVAFLPAAAVLFCGEDQSYRWSDFDFEANAKDGWAIDWPVRYNEIAPWYDHVENLPGVSGSIENIPQLPDGQFSAQWN